jgi:hypothetical protein
VFLLIPEINLACPNPLVLPANRSLNTPAQSCANKPLTLSQSKGALAMAKGGSLSKDLSAIGTRLRTLGHEFLDSCLDIGGAPCFDQFLLACFIRKAGDG